jgi:hypothetical protein
VASCTVQSCNLTALRSGNSFVASSRFQGTIPDALCSATALTSLCVVPALARAGSTVCVVLS